MSTQQSVLVTIISGSASDLTIVDAGLEFLKTSRVSYSVRVASAHRAHNYLQEVVRGAEATGTRLFICIAGMSAHLAGVVAAMTDRPVLAVPVARAETAGLDSLLSMSQMPGGVPVATMGFGKSGFTNACIFAAQVLAGSGNAGVAVALKEHRRRLADDVIASDRQHRRDEYCT